MRHSDDTQDPFGADQVTVPLAAIRDTIVKVLADIRADPVAMAYYRPAKDAPLGLSEYQSVLVGNQVTRLIAARADGNAEPKGSPERWLPGTYVYLSGKHVAYNFNLFDRTAGWLHDRGLRVYNPLCNHKTTSPAPYRQQLAQAFDWICSTAEGMAFLEGWEENKRAKVELALAQLLGLSCYELKVDTSKSVLKVEFKLLRALWPTAGTR